MPSGLPHDLTFFRIMAFLITLAFIALILLCGFMVLVILMQKASQGAGLGGAIGGGAAESAFGGEASNVLTKVTIYCAIIFFLGCLGLSLIILHRHSNPERPVLLEQIEQHMETTPVIAPETTDGEAVGQSVPAEESVQEKVEDAVQGAAKAVEEKAEDVKATVEDAAEQAGEKLEEAKEAVTGEAPGGETNP